MTLSFVKFEVPGDSSSAYEAFKTFLENNTQVLSSNDMTKSVFFKWRRNALAAAGKIRLVVTTSPVAGISNVEIFDETLSDYGDGYRGAVVKMIQEGMESIFQKLNHGQKAVGNSEKSVKSKLLELKELFDDGLIDEKEFNKKKDALLKEM
jgi:hypothetical protein